jgi:hypothetical protein
MQRIWRRRVLATKHDSIAAFEQERDKAFKQNVADDMRRLAKSAGWVERGGRLIPLPQRGIPATRR